MIVRPKWSKQAKLPLSVKVADEIRRAILESQLAPGQRLIEADVARDMGVSRATVRDALRQLEREGLVSVVPWRATTVTGLSERDISEVASLRAKLEKFAVELAIPLLSPSTRGRLQDCVDRMATEAKQNNLAGVNEADYDFHRTIWEIADHQRLLHALESLSRTIRALISMSNLVYPALEGIAADHNRILRAMAADRTDLAKRLIHDHAIQFGESVLSAIRSRSSGSASASELLGLIVRSHP